MTETMQPAAPSASRRRLTPLRPPIDSPAEPAGDATAFAELGCRLARQLFDASLRLDSLHAVYDRPEPTLEELRTANLAVGDVLDQLSTLLHDTGKTILADAIDRIPPDPTRQEWPDPVWRSRRG
jgi:hypothetical protein